MEAIFLFLFFSWLLKGTGKAIACSGRKKKGRSSWDNYSYDQQAWLYDHYKQWSNNSKFNNNFNNLRYEKVIIIPGINDATGKLCAK